MQGLVPTLGEVPPLELVNGLELPPDALAERLVDLGYLRADVVEHRGEFAVRGGVLDVFPGNARRPVRLEYWGDEIESLREFVPSSQLSSGPVVRVQVPPVRELDRGRRARGAGRASARPDTSIGSATASSASADGLHAEGAESLAPLLFDRLPTPAELLPEGSWVVLSDAQRTLDRARRRSTRPRRSRRASGWPGPRAVHPLDEALGDRVQLRLSSFTEGIDLGHRGWGSAQGNPAELAERASGDSPSAAIGSSLSARGHGSLERVREVVRLAARRPSRRRSRTGSCSPAGTLAVATEEDLFGSRRHTRDAPRFTTRRTDAVAEELTPGDFAVHRVHGVGALCRYPPARDRWCRARLHACSSTPPATDCLCRPTRSAWSRGTWVASRPACSRLGARDWARATSQGQARGKDMAGELVRLYSVRMSVARPPFGPDTPWQMELEDAFPHEETGDQLTAIDEVKADLHRPRPMDRLICGDVGFGKTEIAVRAAFKAVMEGKQVAVLVPTTLLAEQHLITFGERYAPFPVKRRDAVAVRLEGRADAGRGGSRARGDRRRDRHASAACPGTWRSRTSASSSSTRSSASALRTRSG